MSSRTKHIPKQQTEIGIVPFASGEEAWFWFITAQTAKSDGARFHSGKGLVMRPCEPVDILKIVDRLYRQRFLLPEHLFILRHYGKRYMPPDPRRVREMRAHTLWKEAIQRIEAVLVRKGIVASAKTFFDETYAVAAE